MFKDPDEAYRNDVGFRAVVDMIEALIHKAEITPAEARAAAVYACIRYESRRLPRMRVKIGPGARAEIDDAERRIQELRRWLDDEIGGG